MRSYTLDAKDQIIAVGGNWDDYALQNDGPGAVSARVMGRVLWDFVHGAATQGFLSHQFYDSRATDTAFARNYRCDSPVQERLFRMEIVPAPGNALCVEHRLLRVRAMPWIPLRDWTGVTAFRRCSQCLACNVGLQWYDNRHFLPPGDAVAIDTICPMCRSTESMQAASRMSWGPRAA